MRNTAGASFRILISECDGDYFASDLTFVTGTANWVGETHDLDTLTWKDFDTDTMSMGTTSATPNLTSIGEVGFVSLTNPGTARIDNIVAKALVVPEPGSVVLPLVLLLAGLLSAGRRRVAR